MRNIYYLFGTTATGKTTCAAKLAPLLNAALVSSDEVYRQIDEMIARLMGPNLPSIVDPENIPRFPPSVQHFIRDKRESLYRKLCDQAFSENTKAGALLVEGACSTHFTDRAALLSHLGFDCREYFLLMDLPFDLWLQFLAGKNNLQLDDLNKRRLDWISQYEIFKSKISIPTGTFRFAHPDLVLLEEPQVYQRPGYTDEKWKLLQMSDNLEGSTVLDLGCNTGWMGKYCLDRGAGAVLGVDQNWRCLAKASDMGLRVFLFDLNELQPTFGRYDYVLCLSMIHYIRDMERFIKAISVITQKEFILEAPMAQNGQDYEEKPGVFQGRAPSRDLLENWLTSSFAEVKYIGGSIAPDPYTKRGIWKCIPRGEKRA